VLSAATGLAVAAQAQSHSAELQKWQHLQSQYREIDSLLSTQDSGQQTSLRRLLAKKVPAAATADEDEDDDGYDDEDDIDEPMTAGMPHLSRCA